MSASFPPKKNAAFTLYTSLVSQGTPATFQSNPTLATGDVKVSLDGGAFANLTTLPVVTPAASKAVKLSLSASEMNADDVAVLFVDASGAEWSDKLISLKTSLRQIDDLVTAGVGAITMTIRTRVGVVAVEGASVWVTTNADGTGLVSGPLTTSSLGLVTVLVDAGTYYVWTQKDGYNPHAGDEWVVTVAGQLEVALVASSATATTITTLRTRLRLELQDEDSDTYRWTNDELDRALQRASAELSQFAPWERVAVVATTDGERVIDISVLDDVVRIEAVEWPVDNFPPAYAPFQWHAGVLELLTSELPTGDDANVYYGQLHQLDESGSSLPVLAEDLVVLGAGGYAAQSWSLAAANRANVQGSDAIAEMRELAEQQLGEFRQQSEEFGDRARVALVQLFKPAEPTGLQRDVVRFEPA